MKNDLHHKEKQILNAQRRQWENSFSSRPEMFGIDPSHPAREAAQTFGKEGLSGILELGAGQGRDALFLAQRGFRVCALDYSEEGLRAIRQKAAALGLSGSVSTVCHDVRSPLPFEDNFFDGCYSHMLFCMALTIGELQELSREVNRVLRPGGFCIYTVRHKKDSHYKTGIYRGEDMYEVGGFVVEFFDRQKVEQLAGGYEILEVAEFEEGGLPRRLFRVTMRKVG